ncbi:MAG: hypothetical protein HUJ26_19125 [Planctomycetaceae bacterium]|nr:hypothetical protein [Planctomycetaceae bacterium]
MQTARRLLLLFFTVACLASLNLSEAKKPDNPGGGGGDGGGGASLSFTPLELTVPEAISTTEGPIPQDISDINHAVGYIQDDQNVSHALYWTIDENGVSSYDLGPDLTAASVNERDEIVGTGRSGVTGENVPILWTDPFSNPIELPLPSGHYRAGTTAVNDGGFVVGWSSELIETTDENGDPVTRQVTHAVTWRFLWIDGTLENSSPLLLGGLEVNESHWADGVSAAETLSEDVDTVKIVGTAYNSIDAQAVIWEAVSSFDDQGELQLDLVAGPTELGTLPGDNGSHGDTINRFGDVAGTPGYRKLYGQPLEELLPPSSINEPGLSYIDDINDLVEVVGVHYHGYGYSTPVLWLTDGSAFDLDKNTGGTDWASFHNPTAINNHQWIVGYGSKYEGKGKNRTTVGGAFLLKPE